MFTETVSSFESHRVILVNSMKQYSSVSSHFHVVARARNSMRTLSKIILLISELETAVLTLPLERVLRSNNELI